MAGDGEERTTQELAVDRAKFRLLKGLPMTTGQVAVLAGCDPKTVGNWIRSEKIAAVRLPGGTWIIAASEVRRVILGAAA